MEKEKNYLIVGTGGVGGSIAGFLALGGKQVTCIARGAQLEAIRQHGLHLKSDLKGEHWLKVPACTAEAYEGKADVIFVCVKGYALDSIQDLLRRVATPDTLVVPILNVYGTGERLARLVPESPSSMQKDLAHGHASEIQGILFDMIALGDRLGVEMPTYRRVAGKFRG